VVHFATFAQTPANDPHWQLNWEDQFNSFDSTKWKKARFCLHGEEPQLYIEEQIWVSNGNLVIQLNNNAVYCPNPAPKRNTWACYECESGKKYNYRSGWVETEMAYNTQFGYIEARIKFPYKRENGKNWSLFPAFWTFIGEGVTGKNAAEIDICEIYGSKHLDDSYNMGVYRRYSTTPPEYEEDSWGDVHTFSNFSYAQWHTYAIEWNKERIIWYLDGKAVNSLSNHRIVDPVRIILNLAVQNHKNHLPPTSPPFTEYMYVDYVRVYSLKCDGKEVVNEIPNFNTYNYAVKKSITMSNATTIPSGQNIHLRATDFIELKAGFEVPVGRELYLDVTPCEETKNIIVSPNFPNPFYDITTIRCYVSAEVQNAKLYISDMGGTIVKTVTITDRDTISIQIAAADLPSAGTYTYLLEGDDEESETLQMILMEESEEMAVYQNYPNPFYDITTIDCYVPQAVQNAQLQIYDKCGFLVKEIAILERGTTTVEIHADELQFAGVYTYLLVGDGKVSETVYMLLE